MNKERAAAYLGAGVKPGEVASIMGCSPGYISQLMKEEGFLLLVKKYEEGNNGSPEREEESIGKKYTGLEHRLIEAMGSAIANAELPAITRALEVVANRQEKVAARKMPAVSYSSGGGIQNHLTIQLTLPGHAIPEQRPVIEMNERSEVVKIGNQAMSPMSSVGVERLFRQKKAESAAERMIMKEIE